MNDPTPRARRAPISPSLVASLLLILGSAVPAVAELRLEVDLSMRMLTAYSGPDVVKTYRPAVD